MSHDTKPTGPTDGDARRAARRHLLRAGAYLVPAVLGSFVMSRKADALSCLPAYCNPVPPCSPNTCKPDLCQPFFTGGSSCRPDFCGPFFKR